jgi:hypothetical protein
LIYHYLEADVGEWQAFLRVREWHVFKTYHKSVCETPAQDVVVIIKQIRSASSWYQHRSVFLSIVEAATWPSTGTARQTKSAETLQSPEHMSGVQSTSRVASPYQSDFPESSNHSESVHGDPVTQARHGRGRNADTGYGFKCPSPSKSCKERFFFRVGNYVNHMDKHHSEWPDHDPWQSHRPWPSSLRGTRRHGGSEPTMDFAGTLQTTPAMAESPTASRGPSIADTPAQRTIVSPTSYPQRVAVEVLQANGAQQSTTSQTLQGPTYNSEEYCDTTPHPDGLRSFTAPYLVNNTDNRPNQGNFTGTLNMGSEGYPYNNDETLSFYSHGFGPG